MALIRLRGWKLAIRKNGWFTDGPHVAGTKTTHNVAGMGSEGSAGNKNGPKRGRARAWRHWWITLPLHPLWDDWWTSKHCKNIAKGPHIRQQRHRRHQGPRHRLPQHHHPCSGAYFGGDFGVLIWSQPNHQKRHPRVLGCRFVFDIRHWVI